MKQWRVRLCLAKKHMPSWETLRAEAAAEGPNRSSEFVRGSLRILLRKIQVGEILVSDLEKSGRFFVTSMMIDDPLLKELKGASLTLGIPINYLYTTAVQLYPVLRQRFLLERAYREAGELGNPELLSDGFLNLWRASTAGGFGSETEARLFAALRTSETRAALLEERVQALEELREYVLLGVQSCKVSPSPQAIRFMDLAELLKLAEIWSVPLTRYVSTKQARTALLAHFKYN